MQQNLAMDMSAIYDLQGSNVYPSSHEKHLSASASPLLALDHFFESVSVLLSHLREILKSIESWQHDPHLSGSSPASSAADVFSDANINWYCTMEYSSIATASTEDQDNQSERLGTLTDPANSDRPKASVRKNALRSRCRTLIAC